MQLQRIGRTGRKRDGHVHVLLSEDREERNWDKADDNYKDVQRFIIKADQLELYDDVERLIPDNIKPTPIEMVMDIEQYTREDPLEKKTQSKVPKAPKRVRDDNAMRNIPSGASTTFVNVRDLLLNKRSSAKKIKNLEDHLSDLDKDDEDDLDIAAGITGPRRTQSMPSTADKRKKKLKPSATMPNGPERKKSTKKKPAPKLNRVQIDQLAATDSEDDDIALGIKAKPSLKTSSKSQRPQKASSSSPTSRSKPVSSKRKSLSPVIELSSSPPLPLTEIRSGYSATSRDQSTQPNLTPTLRGRSLVNEDVVDLTTPAQPSSSLAFRWPTPEASDAEPYNVHVASSPPARLCSASLEAPPASMAWLVDDDDEPEMQIVGSSPLAERRRNVTPPMATSNSEVEIVPELEVTTRSSRSPARPPRKAPSRPIMDNKVPPSQLAMPPPVLPIKINMLDGPANSPTRAAPQFDLSSPALTYAPRGPSKASKKRNRIGSSPVVATPAAAAPRRLRRQLSQELDEDNGSPKPKKRKKTKFADIVEVQKHNLWVDVEAAHSGDELSHGGSENDDDPMSESDMQFVVDDPQTQVSPSYDQSAVYRRSLMTQTPGGSMPAFARRPVKRGGVAYGDGSSKPQANVMMSSSPPQDSGSDDYVYGSFVVDDDADISYANDAQLSSDL